MRRKTVLIAVWALIPVVLWLQPSSAGPDRAGHGRLAKARCTTSAWPGSRWAWPASLFRVLQLAVTQNLFTGIVWATKILTDPFHDIALYWRAPLALLRGELRGPDAPHGAALSDSGPRGRQPSRLACAAGLLFSHPSRSRWRASPVSGEQPRAGCAA